MNTMICKSIFNRKWQMCKKATFDSRSFGKYRSLDGKNVNRIA